MSNIRFSGVMPELVTPFDEQGHVNKKAVSDLMNWHFSCGIKGFYICGSTGEGPTLMRSTRMEMAEIAVETAKNRGVVIDHIGAPNSTDTIELVKHATKIGVDGISSLAPTYLFNYTDDELVDYYRRISDNTDKPVIVYATTAMGVSDLPKLMGRLIEIPNVVGVKFTIHNYFEMRKIKEINGGDINVINGPDETLLCGLVMGADGGIGTTYNLMPDWYVKLYEAFRNNDITLAREYQYKMNHVTDALMRFSSNGCIKATKIALQMKGFDVGGAVYPAHEYSKDERAALKAELQKFGIEF